MATATNRAPNSFERRTSQGSLMAPGQPRRSVHGGESLPTPVTSPTFERPRATESPLSLVELGRRPEGWSQPSNASIEARDIAQSSGQGIPSSSAAELRPSHTKANDQTNSPSFSQEAAENLTSTSALEATLGSGHEPLLSPTVMLLSLEGRSRDVSAGSDVDSQHLSDTCSSQGPTRESRDTDTTTSTHKQNSAAGSSAGTNPSSVSQDACDSRLASEEASQADENDMPETGSKSIPQLNYHHNLPSPRISSAPLESVRDLSNPDLVDKATAINRHLTPNSFYGRRVSMPRPPSVYSTYTDTRGRSPSFTRKSPDTRPNSYAELLNVPYPQPAPAPITIGNSHLRNNVGSNASLLSTQKTLEMYRQNVKKTNDASIQYSFAVFLISTAQEQGFTPDDPARKRYSKIEPVEEDAQSSPTALVREAKNILARLANGSYPFAQYYLADGYASGLFNKGKEDYNAAFPLFVLAAKHGHAEAAYRAGLCYEFGWGCRKDPAKAVQFLRSAAAKSHPGAMTRLGKACLSGELGENRYREGLKWLKRASETADAMYNTAPYHLGQLYETGYGEDIFKDEGYAAELFTQAAELGHAEANFRMGDAYEHGKLNCPRDPALSVHFYTGAAEREHAAAMMGLCAWYMVGADPILEKDEEEAYEWARRSAELGYVKAEYAVGYFTEMGIGCRRDILESNVWYVKAADSGDDRAKQRLAAIRAAASGGGTPMEVAPPRNAKMKKAQGKDGKDDKECSVM